MAQDRRCGKKLARHGIYCMVMGGGASFTYFNSVYRWVIPPEYNRTKGAWLRPVMPALEPYLPEMVMALGVVFYAYAAYCLYRYRALSKSLG